MKTCKLFLLTILVYCLNNGLLLCQSISTSDFTKFDKDVIITDDADANTGILIGTNNEVVNHDKIPLFSVRPKGSVASCLGAPNNPWWHSYTKYIYRHQSSESLLLTDPISSPIEKLSKLTGYYGFQATSSPGYEFFVIGNYGIKFEGIEEEFPALMEINNRDSDGNVNSAYINYDGFIPVLIEAIKEQQKINVELQNQIIELQNELGITKVATSLEQDNAIDDNKLYQSYPNPCKKHCEIEFDIKEHSNNAKIKLFTSTGIIVKEYDISSFNNKVEVSVSHLKAGVYFYSLYINGIKCDTKKMIVQD